MSCLIGYTSNFRLGTKRVSASLYSLRPCTKDVSAHHNTHHAALPFQLKKDGSVGPGDAIECPSAETAIVSAEILSRIEGTIGVAAFSRTGDTETGLFEDAVMLKAFGDIPADLTMMF